MNRSFSSKSIIAESIWVRVGLACGLMLTLASCGGPERVPHQPLFGIDRPHASGTNPHDIATPYPGEGALGRPFLGDFVREVVAVHMDAGGAIAVFPAVTPVPNANDGSTHVNGLGEYLAQRTVLDLEKNGIHALAGSDLILEMTKANLHLAYYASAADALETAKRIGVQYVVTGTTHHKVFNSQKRDEVLEIDWVCRKVSDNRVVARYHAELPGGNLAEELGRHYAQESEWTRAARAEKPAN